MPVCSNKLRENAIAFAEERVATKGEEQTFWNEVLAIFGSLFQGVMEPPSAARSAATTPANATSSRWFGRCFSTTCGRNSNGSRAIRTSCRQFHQKLSQLRFLDPACGCGNFLVIAYRELRLLEIDVLKAPARPGQQRLDIHTLSLVDVDAFYGIEISEWPARIAEVAMWLMDHQMNIRLSEEFGQYFVRLPLTKVADDRLRQRPAAGLEANPSARALQLCAGQPAVRGKTVHGPRARGGHAARMRSHQRPWRCSTMSAPGT